MKINFKSIIVVLLFLTLIAACANSGQVEGNGDDGEDAVGMSVTQTLAALQEAEDGEEEPAAESTEAPPEPPAVSREPLGFEPGAVGGPTPLRLAFVGNDALWVWTEGGTTKELYQGDRVLDVVFSHDGWVIAFTTQGEDRSQNQLWAVNADGSNLTTLLDVEQMNAFTTIDDRLGARPYQLKFIPGTYTLAFNTQTVLVYGGFDPQDDLYMLDLLTGKLTTFYQPGEGGEFAFSPDGSQMVIVGFGDSGGGTVSLVNTDGTNLREDVFTYPDVSTYSEYIYYARPLWWPDGLGLSVVIPSPEPFEPGATMSVWNIPADGSTPTEVGTYLSDITLFGSELLISPDFTKVAYLQRVGEPTDNKWALHIASLDGSSDEVIHSGHLRFDGWSPDSSWVVFQENDDLFISQPGKEGIWPLADVPPTRYMTWIDSSRFIYFSGFTPDFDIRLGSFSGPSVSIAKITVKYPIYAVAIP